MDEPICFSCLHFEALAKYHGRCEVDGQILPDPEIVNDPAFFFSGSGWPGGCWAGESLLWRWNDEESQVSFTQRRRN